MQLRVQRVRDGALARNLVLPSVFVIAILASNYLLAALPNVKLFDLLVFAAGYSLGVRRGATVAITAWYFYGQTNPFGPAQASLLVTLMVSETAYAILGGLVRRIMPPSSLSLGSAWSSVLLVSAALIATSGYDLATNVYTGYFWASIAGSQDYSRWVWTAVSNPGALFFMLVHVGGNAVMFPVFVPLVVKGVEGAKGRWGLL